MPSSSPKKKSARSKRAAKRSTTARKGVSSRSTQSLDTVDRALRAADAIEVAPADRIPFAWGYTHGWQAARRHFTRT